MSVYSLTSILGVIFRVLRRLDYLKLTRFYGVMVAIIILPII